MKFKFTLLALTSALLIGSGANAGSLVLKKKVKKSDRSVASMPEKPINIKMNLMALGFRNISLFGEYAFHEKMSGQLGIRFMIPYFLPTGASSSSSSSAEITNATMSGWAVTPEFRFYPGKHEDAPAPHGFYIGVYGRYSKFNLNIGTKFDDPVNIGTKKIIDFKIGLNHMGAGLILGKQWAIKGFTVDWWILAGGVGLTNFAASIKDDIFKDPTVTQALQDNFSTSGNALFDPKFSVDNSSGTIKLSQSTNGFSLRSLLLGGLCMGYHF